MPDLQTLVDGLALGESPRWHEGRLWFSDWIAREIVAADLDGATEVVAEMASLPFCFDWLPGGPLLVVSGPAGLLLRREPDGSLVTHADLTRLSDRPWNEIVVDGRGNAYVNGIGFDLMSGEAPAPGLIVLVTPDGRTRRVAGGVAFPNGMVVTPDNATLVVAESYASRLTAFDIAADGGLSNRRVWAQLDGGYPDGLCLDAEGAIWYGDVPNKRCVRVRAGGEVLDSIELDRGCFACALGGAGGDTLFMMAAEWNGPDGRAGGARSGKVVATQAPVRGAGWP